MTRDELLDALSRRLTAIMLDHPLRVAIDGPDAAGKTMLADALARQLAVTGRQILRASIDGFHRPRAERYRQGPLSPAGYYEDSFDNDAIIEQLLGPLAGCEFPVDCCTACFDYRTDHAVRPARIRVVRNAMLLSDGIFLFRPELVDYWDLRIYVRVEPEISFDRGVARDTESMDERSVIVQKYRERYLPGQQIYRELVDPESLAHVLIDNNDPAAPALLTV